MSDQILIEVMSYAHLDEVLKIEKESFKNPWSNKLLQEELSNPFSNNYIAKIDSNPISNTIAYISYRIVLKDMELMKIAVHSDYRNCGIASFLLMESLNHAKNKGAENAFLEVNENNRAAIGFYLKNNYQICGKRTGYYEDGDAVLMKRDL